MLIFLKREIRICCIMDMIHINFSLKLIQCVPINVFPNPKSINEKIQKSLVLQQPVPSKSMRPFSLQKYRWQISSSQIQFKHVPCVQCSPLHKFLFFFPSLTSDLQLKVHLGASTPQIIQAMCFLLNSSQMQTSYPAKRITGCLSVQTSYEAGYNILYYQLFSLTFQSPEDNHFLLLTDKTEYFSKSQCCLYPLLSISINTANESWPNWDFSIISTKSVSSLPPFCISENGTLSI